VVDTCPAFDPIGFQPGSGCTRIAAGQLLNGTVTRFKLTGRTFGTTQVPADATGVLVNVTLVRAVAAGGYLTVYPGDAPSPPNASTVNPSAATAADFWATGLGAAGAGANAGTLAVFSAGDPRDVVTDLVGYLR